MKDDLLRTLDRWIGVPACFLMSVVYKLFGRRRARSAQAMAPAAILFVELSEMGSAVLAYPAMRYAVERYPEAEVYFAVFERNRASVDILGIIPPDHVLTVDADSPFAFARDTMRVLGKIRRAGIDTVIDLERLARFTALLSGLSGARMRVGFYPYLDEGLYRGDFLTHPVRYGFYQHMAYNFLALVKALEQQREGPLLKAVLDDPLPLPRYRSSEADLARWRGRLAALAPDGEVPERLVLFNMSDGGALPNRAWPTARYVELGREILAKENTAVILVGSADARENAAFVFAQIQSERCFDLTEQTTLPELVDLCNLAQVLVTADSGVAHFASLADIRTIVLFGPETPRLYAPLGERVVCLTAGLACSPCFSIYNHCQTVCRDALCMEAISVERVFSELMAALS